MTPMISQRWWINFIKLNSFSINYHLPTLCELFSSVFFIFWFKKSSSHGNDSKPPLHNIKCGLQLISGSKILRHVGANFIFFFAERNSTDESLKRKIINVAIIVNHYACQGKKWMHILKNTFLPCNIFLFRFIVIGRGVDYSAIKVNQFFITFL